MEVFKNIMIKAIHIIESITSTHITVQPKSRIKVHPNAISDGSSMKTYVSLVNKFANFEVRNIFEIGANYAQDADFLRKSFNVNPENVYVFEPHPQIFDEIKRNFTFNVFDYAVSNTPGRTTFNAIDLLNNVYRNSGISSLRDGLTTDPKNFLKVEVDLIRMDDFMLTHGIESIDFLKVDVEGMNYEVLEGFGEFLPQVKAIQTEGEYKQYWEGQRLYQQMHDLLIKNHFRLIYFALSADGIQSDSFWINEKFVKTAN